MSSPERRGVKRKHGLELGVQISGKALALGSVLSSFWTTTRNSKCRIFDANTLADPAASKRLDGFSLLSLHSTPFDPKAQALANRTWGYCGWNATQSNPAQCHTAGHCRLSLSCHGLSPSLLLVGSVGLLYGVMGSCCITGEHLTASVYQAHHGSQEHPHTQR